MIYIVIPVHNRKIFTKECLLSLQKQSFKDFQIIVIDDGSTDGTAEMIENEFPNVVLLKGNGNLWWTGATNKGVQYALAKGTNNDYILTLNDDLVVKENYLESIFQEATIYKNSLIGSVSVDISNPTRIFEGGDLINFWTAKYIRINKGKLLLNISPTTSIEVSTLSGRGTLIPFSVFKKIGIYNSRKFPQYAADYEFAIRAKRNGFKLIISYRVVLLSHIKETGIGEKNKNNFFQYFFSIKSPENIFYRIRFASAITKNPLQFIIFLTFDFIRIFGHYCRNRLIR